MKIYLFVNPDERAAKVADDIKPILSAGGHNVVDDPASADLIISVGGDGTLLYAIREYLHLKIPFLAVNGGTAGFRCAIQRDEMNELLEALYWEPYALGVFEVEWDGNKQFAIQDMRVERPTHRPLRFQIEENGEVLTSLHAGCGIILSGALGSTGCNRSYGGPRIALTEKTIVMTPMAPMQLSAFDSILESREVMGEVKLVPKYPARLVLDDHAFEVEGGTEVIVRPVHNAFKLITRERER